MNLIYLSSNRQYVFLLQLILPERPFIRQAHSLYELVSLSLSVFSNSLVYVVSQKKNPGIETSFNTGMWSGHVVSYHLFPYVTDPVWFPDKKCARPRCWETMKP